VDKVYITKDELTKSIYDQKQKAGPLLITLIFIGLGISLLWAIPLVVFWMAYVVICMPFHFIDRLLFTRRK